MSKIEDYRAKLRTMTDWEPFLLKESGLPGPRGNLELAQAVADEGTARQFDAFLSYNAERAPTNTPEEFLAVCGAVGLGRLAAEGDRAVLRRLRVHAADTRWRMREGVVMALQRLGDKNMDRLLREMEKWSRGNCLERRAAAAALCEPRLLHDPSHVRRVFDILDAITASIASAEERREESFLALRKGLGYCWSVAVAALPREGKARMEKWLPSKDKDIRWIMRENLKKDRLKRMDAKWVNKWAGKQK